MKDQFYTGSIIVILAGTDQVWRNSIEFQLGLQRRLIQIRRTPNRWVW